MHNIVCKFQAPNYDTFWDMNYFLQFLVQSNFGPVQTTDDRQQTESDAYEPIVQIAQVGSKKKEQHFNILIWVGRQ